MKNAKPEQILTLSDSQKNLISRDILALMEHFKTDDNGFLHPSRLSAEQQHDTALAVAQSIKSHAPEIYEAMQAVGQKTSGTPFLYITNTPVDTEDGLEENPGAEPSIKNVRPVEPSNRVARRLERNATLSDYFSLGAQYALRDPASSNDHTIYWGDVIPDINRFDVILEQFEGRRPHNDSPGIFALHTIEGTPQEKTVVYSLEQLNQSLSRAQIELLQSPHFCDRDDSGNPKEGVKYPILTENNGVLQFAPEFQKLHSRVDFENERETIVGIDNDSRIALEALFSAVEYGSVKKGGTGFNLQKGDLLIIDQDRSLHATTGQKSAADRWLVRTSSETSKAEVGSRSI